MTGRIDSIVLDRLLPDVFRGMALVSDVWNCRVDIRRSDGAIGIAAESGSGKSSLVSFIYGERTDYSGSILFNGEPVEAFSIDRWCDIRRRHIALLPQQLNLFPELTVIDNILLKNRLTDFKSAAEIRIMLQRLEIDGKADMPAGRLSVGQQQRAAMVRALCQPFDFLLLDEPVSHLDRRNNSAVAALVAEEAAARQAAVIATSVGNPLLLTQLRTISL